MDYIKDIGIDKMITISKMYSALFKQQLQVEIINEEKNEEFTRYLISLAEYTYVDALGGSKAPDGVRRYNIDKKPETVLKHAKTAIGCGIKIVHTPLMNIMEWDKWENGYIEGFIRMDGDSEHGEYFIWTYIKMGNLKDILTKWENDLITWVPERLKGILN